MEHARIPDNSSASRDSNAGILYSANSNRFGPPRPQIKPFSDERLNHI